MIRPALLLSFLPVVFLATPSAAAEPPTPRQLEFFEKQVRPVLVAKCYSCHSAKAKSLKGELLLDSRQGWVKGGESGPAIIPGNPAESLLIQAIKYDGLEMPPKERLSTQQIADLVRWVKMGAPDPRTGQASGLIRREIDIVAGRKYWAFRPPIAPGLPAVDRGDWPADPIDHFILAKLETVGLAPVADADRATLARRLYFDLVGLPPTPEQLDAFLTDKSAGAFESLVDRLLASPRYGERWGRHWLDVVRYAESTGMERNFTFPHAWRYRDYVIDAFNRDVPYDRFLIEQVAGDLLPAKSDAERDRLSIATGFLALGPKTLNQRNREIFWMDIVDEQIDITTRAVLGLTVSCARCHDHKFDPIPTEDYYAIAGIFRSTDTLFGTSGGQGNRQATGLVPLKKTLKTGKTGKTATTGKTETTPRTPAAGTGKAKRIKQLTGQLGKARAALKAAQSAAKDKNKQQRKRALRPLRNKVKQLTRQLQQAGGRAGKRRGGNKKPTGPVAMGVRDATPADCRVHIRGNVRTLGKSVSRGTLQVVQFDSAPAINSAQSGRLELAAWLTSRDNPLVARVMVNRVWYHLTGRGLVVTLDNFGAMGQRPSHPALLDHLAVQFLENGWSIKRLVKQIVLSRTYRLASTLTPAGQSRDPQNSFFWRMNHRRLDAESIRDAILSASGQLDLTPRQRSAVAEIGDANIGRNAGANNRLDAASRHRSVYLPIVRNWLPEMLGLFDFAEPSIIVGRRDVTTVPAQALYLLNSPFILAQSDQMATRVLASAGDDEARVDQAYRLALARSPSAAELQASLGLIRDTLAGLPAGNADKNRRLAWSGLCQALLACAEFRYLQ